MTVAVLADLSPTMLKIPDETRAAFLCGVVFLFACAPIGLFAADNPDAERPTLRELKLRGAKASAYLNKAGDDIAGDVIAGEEPKPQLATFRREIAPVLKQVCVDCHGPDAQEGNIRIDTLDPDLVQGADADWWTEVFAVITKGEMPPPDEGDLDGDAQRKLVDWLSSQLQTASIVRQR